MSAKETQYDVRLHRGRSFTGGKERGEIMNPSSLSSQHKSQTVTNYDVAIIADINSFGPSHKIIN
jgi:hypothetical protein